MNIDRLGLQCEMADQMRDTVPADYDEDDIDIDLVSVRSGSEDGSEEDFVQIDTEGFIRSEEAVGSADTWETGQPSEGESTRVEEPLDRDDKQASEEIVPGIELRLDPAVEEATSRGGEIDLSLEDSGEGAGEAQEGGVVEEEVSVVETRIDTRKWHAFHCDPSHELVFKSEDDVYFRVSKHRLLKNRYVTARVRSCFTMASTRYSRVPLPLNSLQIWERALVLSDSDSVPLIYPLAAPPRYARTNYREAR